MMEVIWMKKAKQIVVLLLVAILILLCFSGCNDEDKTFESSNSSETIKTTPQEENWEDKVKAASKSAETTTVNLDFSKKISAIPEGYLGVGYNGWGDITDEQAIKYFNDVGIKFVRMDIDLKKICGDSLGDFSLDYTRDQDEGLGFSARVQKIIDNGWTPLISVNIRDTLPKWFTGEVTDKNNNAWFRYNSDGTKSAIKNGTQYNEITDVMEKLVKALMEEGFKGLHWETIYEMGAEMPLADIHYYVARGIKNADANSVIMGPATWPGWTVEDKFVKPFLKKYGAELLDMVSLHHYSSNSIWDKTELWDFEKTVITMADTVLLEHIMETVPLYADWSNSLKKVLKDTDLNPSGKEIGIVYTEFDANAYFLT